MSTSRANLDVTQYVRVAEKGVAILLQSHRDHVRIVFSDVKPALSNTVFHELSGSDQPLHIPYTDTGVWALALTNTSSLVITSQPLGDITALSSLEAAIEDGNGYSLFLEVEVANNDTNYYVLKTPVDKVIRVKGRTINTGGGLRYEPMVDAVFTLDENISTDQIRNMSSTNVSSLEIHTATNVTDGKAIDVVRTSVTQGSSGNPATLGTEGSERVLAKDTTYLLKFDNIDNNEIWCIYSLVWTELDE